MSERQNRGLMAWLGQGLLYGLFAVIIGVFSTWPRYHYLDDNQALIKLSFNHQGQIVADRRDVSAEVLAKLKPDHAQDPDLPTRTLSDHGRTRHRRQGGAARCGPAFRPLARRRLDHLPPAGGSGLAATRWTCAAQGQRAQRGLRP